MGSIECGKGVGDRSSDHQSPSLVRVRWGQGLEKPGIFHILNTSREGMQIFVIVCRSFWSNRKCLEKSLGVVHLAESELINKAGR